MTFQDYSTGDIKADARKPEKAKNRLINLDAKPGAITLDPAMTAMIVVDMQNDFGSKGGMFDRAGFDIRRSHCQSPGCDPGVGDQNHLPQDGVQA